MDERRTAVMRTGVVLALSMPMVVCSVGGCGKNKPENNPKKAVEAARDPAKAAAPKQNDQPAKAAPAPASAKPEKAAPQVDAARVAPPIKQEQLQALFDSWLTAQNNSNFETYSKLYAERFMGVKRSGPRTRTFKREGWLRDRKRMFAKAMVVKAARVEMAATAESAVINFEQVWASGTYKDIGPKQLVVVREEQGLRIAREEMLRSEVASGESSHKPLSKDAFGFVVFAAEASWVVLDTRPKSKWATGAPKLLSIQPYAVSLRDVDMKAVPKQASRMVNREMRLFGATGQICRGHIDKLALLSRVRPHFGTVNYWKGDEGGKPLPSAKIAKEAWDLGDAGRLLVGRIKPVKANECRGTLWARDAAEAEPAVIGPVSVQPLLLKAAQTAFRKLKGYGEIQKSYIEMTSLPRPKYWDKFEGGAPKISILANADGSQKYIAMAATAGTGCGDFIGEYWAIWRVMGSDDKPRLVLVTDDRAPGRYFMPRTAADIDGDGTLEFIGTDAVLQPVGAVLRETDGVEVPDLDCPC